MNELNDIISSNTKNSSPESCCVKNQRGCDVGKLCEKELFKLDICLCIRETKRLFK